ncbi:MAG: hypothetical protein JWM31_1508 [Solirubrobacterales bacterium]|nr:hypothetical protein [Solirubrobacterales bacterium]
MTLVSPTAHVRSGFEARFSIRRDLQKFEGAIFAFSVSLAELPAESCLRASGYLRNRFVMRPASRRAPSKATPSAGAA